MRAVDLGEFAQPLRRGVVLDKPGKNAELVAPFKRENEAAAYRIARTKAEEKVA